MITFRRRERKYPRAWVLEILERMGFQTEPHLGAKSVLFILGLRMWMAACSVKSSCDLEVRDFKTWMSFQAMVWPVVREW